MFVITGFDPDVDRAVLVDPIIQTDCPVCGVGYNSEGGCLPAMGVAIT